ncbi:MAG: lipid-A-disaccharide synthase [Thermomonas sp.]|uniref:lipid-A-disaccharide synthase n=1 Tax=Thermomonas sp. TaxID=1971895 RepID=UPI001DC0193F|nr:lipid-A-disaccharide synthase [Thermomonas sp.]MBZ0088697.1 lipid-A-disaccharide synthase [Thermomonas sp.]MCO5054825.1 lipid-A-disaccharide synthase [Thermomonas sp.]
MRFALCAGETSGDQLGAGLIDALRERFPDAQFAGIGGNAMRAAGMDTWFDAGELAVMGLFEVLAHLPRLLKLRSAFRQRVLGWKPDVFIGIDAPDFNLGVERWLKQRGVRTVHDVSPSIWAWRQGRAAKIGQSADRVLCLFPMEPPIYAKHGVTADFIGHPLADAIPLQPDQAAARAVLDEPVDAPLLALLPGSRLGEIRRMLPDFAEAARRLVADIPGLRVLVPAANAQCRAAIDAILGDAPGFRVIDGQAQRLIIASDCVLLASGTAALEAMLCKRPMVVGHRIAPLTYHIVKLFGLLKSRHVSLPNVLAGETLVPELLQHDCTPDTLHAALLRWFRDADAVAALQPRFLEIHQTLRRDASQRAAEAVVELLGSAPSPSGRGLG